jgi:hypothetical protein
MNWKKLLVIFGFVFAVLAFISPFLLMLYLNFWMSSTALPEFIEQATANPFPPFTLIVNPPVMGVLGIAMGTILKRWNEEDLKKWGNRVIYVNFAAVPIGFFVWFLTMIIPL